MANTQVVMPSPLDYRINEDKWMHLAYGPKFCVDHMFVIPLNYYNGSDELPEIFDSYLPIDRVFYEVTWYDSDQDVAYSRISEIKAGPRKLYGRIGA